MECRAPGMSGLLQFWLALHVLNCTITAAGAHGTAPSPPYFVLRSPVAELDGAVIRALSVGEAEFRILPFCRYLREGTGAARATVIPVVVRP